MKILSLVVIATLVVTSASHGHRLFSDALKDILPDHPDNNFSDTIVGRAIQEKSGEIPQLINMASRLKAGTDDSSDGQDKLFRALPDEMDTWNGETKAQRPQVSGLRLDQRVDMLAVQVTQLAERIKLFNTSFTQELDADREKDRVQFEELAELKKAGEELRKDIDALKELQEQNKARIIERLKQRKPL